MANIFEDYRMRQAAKAGGQRFHSPKAGRIDARPRNVVRDPATGARVGVTRKDGSFIPMSGEMSRPGGTSPPRTFPSRADKVAAARADGTFETKRQAFNQSATDREMDALGNIRMKPSHKITQGADGSRTLTSRYGTGSSIPQRPAQTTPPGLASADAPATINPPVGSAPSPFKPASAAQPPAVTTALPVRHKTPPPSRPLG